jgi:hypothetical protein
MNNGSNNCSSECMNGGSCVNGMCMCTSAYIGPTCQYGKSKKKNVLPSLSFVFWIENPCNHQNPCLNSGTCFGRYSTNGTLLTQCFCLQGFTGNYCEGIEKKDILNRKFAFLFLATLCSSTSCNGGVCKATQNSIVCVCPPGKVGDRCQVIIPFFSSMVLICNEKFLVWRCLCKKSMFIHWTMWTNRKSISM